MIPAMQPARTRARAAAPTIEQLRRHALARSLFAPTTLPRALARLGFVQADPIRAPARAQDLVLRQRVEGYRAGDLEQRYPRLAIEEDFFINYGFVPKAVHALMHPRTARRAWPRERWAQAESVRAFVQARGVVHPREVDAAFAHGKTKNWFGGSSNASTQLLDGMHYRGLLRVARREGGVRLYAAHEAHAGPAPAPAEAEQAIDALVDLAVALYAPVNAGMLSRFVSWIGMAAVPQWMDRRRAALARAQARLPSAEVDGQRWFWPAGENPASKRHAPHEGLRLLAPFDPVVWDRPRFEAFWGWAYRFEAYVPAAQRVRGYYALPLLWQEAVVGWANCSVVDGALQVQPGYVAGKAPRDAGFRRALADEADAMARFLGLGKSRLVRSAG